MKHRGSSVTKLEVENKSLLTTLSKSNLLSKNLVKQSSKPYFPPISGAKSTLKLLHKWYTPILFDTYHEYTASSKILHWKISFSIASEKIFWVSLPGVIAWLIGLLLIATLMLPRKVIFRMVVMEGEVLPHIIEKGREEVAEERNGGELPIHFWKHILKTLIKIDIHIKMVGCGESRWWLFNWYSFFSFIWIITISNFILTNHIVSIFNIWLTSAWTRRGIRMKEWFRLLLRKIFIVLRRFVIALWTEWPFTPHHT